MRRSFFFFEGLGPLILLAVERDETNAGTIQIVTVNSFSSFPIAKALWQIFKLLSDLPADLGCFITGKRRFDQRINARFFDTVVTKQSRVKAFQRLFYWI
jgi:hypothetical protein